MGHRTITKVKYSKGRVHIAYEVERAGADEPDEYLLKCGEAPTPAFTAAMAALAVHAANEAEMPNAEAWAANAEVKSVSFSWSKDVMGAVITVLKPLEHSQSPLLINTPHKPEVPYSDGDPDAEGFCLHGATVAALETLLKEADGYLKGQRAQMALPLEPSE